MNTTAQPILTATDLTMDYAAQAATPRTAQDQGAFAPHPLALNRVNFTLRPGETVAVMGPSGSGKSTLLHALAGIITPTAGTVQFRGANLAAMPDAERTALRRNAFGFVFQSGQLLPELPAVENIALPLMLGGMPYPQATSQAVLWLERFGLRPLMAQRPGEMSGGQMQRVAIARALSVNPAIIFADEPTGALDQTTGHAVMRLLMDAARQQRVRRARDARPERGRLLLAHRAHARRHDHRRAAHPDSASRTPGPRPHAHAGAIAGRRTMSTFALWRLFHRPARGVRGSDSADSTTMLAVFAFAAATAIFLTVLGGLHGFIWRASPDHTIPCLLDESHCSATALAAHKHVIATSAAAADQANYASTYIVLAMFACLLLLVPFAALAGSAARLAASRRDARLAALRLAGATTGQVVRLTAFDSALQALAGALIGIAGYFALMPLIMLLTFQNQHFTFAQLWVGPVALVATVAGVTLLALVSALLTLRRVAITPLGVSARQGQPLPSKIRLLIFAVAVIGALAILSNMQLINAGTGAMIAIIFGLIVGCFALINLVGSFAVTIRARSRARRPRNAATMIAMRRILDNPKRAWRNVSGIGLAVFIAGITSVCSLFGSLASGDPNSADAIMMRDIGTGGLLTLAFAGVLAAVSSGVMQSASVIDQSNEYNMLVLEGTDEATLRKARFQEVLTPLNTVVLLAGVCSLLLLAPLVGNAFTQPGPLISFVGGAALCYALVLVGAVAANRTAARLACVTARADD